MAADTEHLLEALGKPGLIERVDKTVLAEGLANFKPLVERVREHQEPSVQGIGDDFIPDSRLYNMLGALYPALDREQRDAVLRALWVQFSSVNDFHVQENHTSTIREPLLLGDIGTVKRHYWPGLEEATALVGRYASFEDFRAHQMTDEGLFQVVRSDFCVAYALLRVDKCRFGSDYVRAAHPAFLERTVRGIVAMRFGDYSEEAIVRERGARLRELLPVELHSKIEEYRREVGWASKSNFS